MGTQRGKFADECFINRHSANLNSVVSLGIRVKRVKFNFKTTSYFQAFSFYLISFTLKAVHSIQQDCLKDPQLLSALLQFL
jgi:hypothetical protein